ncbi:MAG: DUF4365 domain-containing protein [Oscillospiraceae bacterium]|nr:DUF4365 domain-containing protein [Oscillospiraceae bacterium]
MPPNRHDNHIIDSLACGLVAAQFDPKTWIVRDVTERDYGIDKIVERFDSAGFTTGDWALLQIKGTKDTHPKRASTQIYFWLNKKTIEYAQQFTTPFYLVRCYVEPNISYFVWLQHYIECNRNTLEERTRKVKKIEIEEVKIVFPKQNMLNAEGFIKMERAMLKEKSRKYFMQLFIPIDNIANYLRRLEYHFDAHEFTEFKQIAAAVQQNLNDALAVSTRYADISACRVLSQVISDFDALLQLPHENIQRHDLWRKLYPASYLLSTMVMSDIPALANFAEKELGISWY